MNIMHVTIATFRAYEITQLRRVVDTFVNGVRF